MPERLESAESASPLITRLVAGSLSSSETEGVGISRLERLGLRLLEPLPARFARELAAWRVAGSAIPRARAIRIRTEELTRARLDDYHALERRFEVILCGSALGGAAAHLAAAVGGPFLPQPFILGLQGGTRDDRVESYLDRVSPVAEAILQANPQLTAIAHFDPVHDGWLTRSLAHLRLKLIDLPLDYMEFIRRKLNPGGAVVYLDCSARWLQYPLGNRYSLQVGGWGGISPEEFLEGSTRLDRFLSASGSQHSGGWQLSGHEPAWFPESEWGSQPGLDRALEAFARVEGFRFERIRFDHPHDFSRLAFAAHRELYARAGVEPRGVLVEMFTQYAPWTVIERGLLPLWLVFNTQDSLAFLQRERRHFPAGRPVFLSALVTLSRTPDMVAWDDWAAALEGFEWHSVGARREKYPEDLLALGRWVSRLQELTAPVAHVPDALPLEALVQLASAIQASG